MEDRRIDVGSVARVLLMILVLAIWMLAVLSLRADEPPVVFDKDKQGWTVPPGFKKYKQTQYSQRIANTGGRDTISAYHRSQDDHWINAPTSFNPNRFAPYAVPAGLDEVSNWTSETYYSLPEGAKIKAWTSRVPIAMGGLLPKRQWRFPDGTVFLESLRNESSGEVFELRRRIRVNGAWVSSVPVRKLSAAPAGYTGKLSKSCADCHAHAGNSETYGVVIRGADGVFSFPVLKEGTTDWDTSLPLDFSQPQGIRTTGSGFDGNGPAKGTSAAENIEGNRILGAGVLRDSASAGATTDPAGQQLQQPTQPGFPQRGRLFGRRGRN